MPIVLLIAAFFFASAASADVEQTLAEFRMAARANACAKMYGELGVLKAIPAELFKPEMKNGKFSMHDLPGRRLDAVYIGIANHQKDGTHHYYLNVGKTHFSALPFYGRSIVSNGNVGTKGLLFEIPVPPELIAALEARAKSGDWVNRDLSCLHAVCKLLQKEGVEIATEDGRQKITARVVMANLSEGKIKVQGKDLDPATMRLLATGGGELSNALERSLMADELVRARGVHKLMFWVAGSAAGGGAMTGVAFLGWKMHGEADAKKAKAEKFKFSPRVDD